MHIFTRKNTIAIIKNVYAYSKLIALLAFLWIIFSGSSKSFLVFCGFLSILITFVLCYAFKVISPKTYIIKISFFKYVFMLLRDVVISTKNMIKIIYSDNISINPGTLSVNTKKLNEQEKVMFSNLITMTPGTFVIATNGSEFLVHTLNRGDFNNDNNKELANLFNKMRK